MRVRPALLVVALAAAGCTHRAADAMLRPVCAPNDEGAVELTVPAAPGERFRLRLAGRLIDYSGQRVDVGDPDVPGPSAQWCDARGCRVIRGAGTTVRFGRVRGDSSVDVHVLTGTAEGKPFLWSGTARWRGQALVCG